jgi:hypothetical protein
MVIAIVKLATSLEDKNGSLYVGVGLDSFNMIIEQCLLVVERPRIVQSHLACYSETAGMSLVLRKLLISRYQRTS